MRTSFGICLISCILLSSAPTHANTFEHLRDGTVSTVDSNKRLIAITLTPARSERDRPPHTIGPIEVTADARIVFITATNGRKKASISDIKPGMHVRFSGSHGHSAPI